MKRILKLEPYFKDVLWGGTALSDVFGMNIPTDTTGEAFSASTVPGFCSTVGGEDFSRYAGDSSYTGEGGFNILFKLIDAKEPLSVQVHPDDELAKKLEGGRGKTECWYVLDCPEDARLVIGHNARTREELSDMIHGGRWKELLRYVPVKKGDLVPIPAGTVHAITAGMLVLETQQNSDITYRMYDYDRLMNGKPRQLHVNQCIDVVRVPAASARSSVIHAQDMGENSWAQIYACDYFTVYRMNLSGKASLKMDAPFVDVSIVEGEGTLNGTAVRKGDHFILTDGYGQQDWSGRLLAIASTAVRK